MSRIPELEQELVAAAARLQSPRRVLRPGARAALAAAVAVVVALVAVEATEHDRGDRGRQPAGAPPSQRGEKVGIDIQTGVRLSLDGHVLTASLLSWAPSETYNRVSGARIRATCGKTFTTTRDVWPTRTRLWPVGRETLQFRFTRDASSTARWCRVEDPAVGNVAFVKFGSAPRRAVSREQRIELSANAWARVFASSGRAACEGYMVQPACERMDCMRVGHRPIENCTPLSPPFRKSFRRATVEEIEVRGDRAAVRFSNGELVELENVEQNSGGGVWWISKVGGGAGRGFFEN